jgi:hypothetical protein
VANPLKPGFSFRRDDSESLWIFFKYERLDIYCSYYGRIGHKSANCMAALEEKTPASYVVSLKVDIFYNLISSSHTSSINPTTNNSQTQPTNPHTSAMVFNQLSGTNSSPNPLAKPLLKSTQPASSSKQLDILPPILNLATDTS